MTLAKASPRPGELAFVCLGGEGESLSSEKAELSYYPSSWARSIPEEIAEDEPK